MKVGVVSFQKPPAGPVTSVSAAGHSVVLSGVPGQRGAAVSIRGLLQYAQSCSMLMFLPVPSLTSRRCCCCNHLHAEQKLSGRWRPRRGDRALPRMIPALCSRCPQRRGSLLPPVVVKRKTPAATICESCRCVMDVSVYATRGSTEHLLQAKTNLNFISLRKKHVTIMSV